MIICLRLRFPLPIRHISLPLSRQPYLHRSIGKHRPLKSFECRQHFWLDQTAKRYREIPSRPAGQVTDSKIDCRVRNGDKRLRRRIDHTFHERDTILLDPKLTGALSFWPIVGLVILGHRLVLGHGNLPFEPDTVRTKFGIFRNRPGRFGNALSIPLNRKLIPLRRRLVMNYDGFGSVGFLHHGKSAHVGLPDHVLHLHLLTGPQQGPIEYRMHRSLELRLISYRDIEPPCFNSSLPR